MDAAGAIELLDARAPAGRALEGVGPIRDLRRLADEADDQRRPSDGARADPRGGDHRHGPRPDPVVQAIADHALPDPDQVSRRAPAAVRHRADPRIHHEGRLQHRRRHRPAQQELRRDVRGLLPDLRPLRRALRDRRGRERPDRRRLVARVHGPLLDRRRQGHPVRRLRLRGQPGAGRDRRRDRRPRSRRPPTPPLRGGRDAQQADDPRGLRVPQGRRVDVGQAAGLPGRRQAGGRPGPRATTSSTRPSSAGRSARRPWSPADAATIEKATGAPMGFLGPGRDQDPAGDRPGGRRDDRRSSSAATRSTST